MVAVVSIVFKNLIPGVVGHAFGLLFVICLLLGILALLVEAVSNKKSIQVPEKKEIKEEKPKKMSENKWLIPISIVIGALVLGVCFYLVQKNKQLSIEKQQKVKIVQEKEENCQKLAIDRKKNLEDQNPLYLEYHYNKNTGNCVLAYTQYHLSSQLFSFYGTYTIIDLFSDKKLYSDSVSEQGEKAMNSYNKFLSMAERYFYQQSTENPY